MLRLQWYLTLMAFLINLALFSNKFPCKHFSACIHPSNVGFLYSFFFFNCKHSYFSGSQFTDHSQAQISTLDPWPEHSSSSQICISTKIRQRPYNTSERSSCLLKLHNGPPFLRYRPQGVGALCDPLSHWKLGCRPLPGLLPLSHSSNSFSFWLCLLRSSPICPHLSFSAIKLNHMQVKTSWDDTATALMQSFIAFHLHHLSSQSLDPLPPAFYSSAQAWSVRWVMRLARRPPCGIFLWSMWSLQVNGFRGHRCHWGQRGLRAITCEQEWVERVVMGVKRQLLWVVRSTTKIIWGQPGDSVKWLGADSHIPCRARPSPWERSLLRQQSPSERLHK